MLVRSFFHHHDDVIKWKHFSRYWPFVRGIHRWPVNSPHKGQWRGAFMFSLICGWINAWVNNRAAGDLRRHRAHYDVTVMPHPVWFCFFRFTSGIPTGTSSRISRQGWTDTYPLLQTNCGTWDTPPMLWENGTWAWSLPATCPPTGASIPFMVNVPLWRHNKETLSALLTLCERKPP